MKIASVECLDQSIERYDLEIEDNHNFVANGIVVHNSNSRYVFSDGKMHCGSRTEWKKEFSDFSHVTVESLVEKGKTVEEANFIVQKLSERAVRKNMWWTVLDRTPGLRKLCEAHPNLIVYGESFGAVQDLNYGRNKGEVDFAAFDIMKDGKWMNFHEAYALAQAFDVPWVPILAQIQYDFDTVCSLAEGKTTVKFPEGSTAARHVREGCVVRPVEERYHPKIGRVCLKWVGAGYLEKSNDDFAPEEDFE